MRKNYKVIFPEKNKVELVEWEMPEVGDNDMLIETEVSLISTGTELTLFEGNVEPGSAWEADLNYPIYKVGYSSVGKIVEVGKDVSKEFIGKRVCASAPHQKYNVKPADAYEGLMWIPDGVVSEDATFSTIAAITMGSVRCSQIKPGDACVVFGAGIIGQMVSRFAKMAGSTRVIVVDVTDYRLDKLPNDPCFIKVNSKKEDVIESVKKHTRNGEMAPVVFETTSVPSLVEQEVKCVAKGGKLIITSSPKGKSVIDLDYCSRMGISIVGAHNWVVHPPCESIHNRWTRRRDSDYFLELLDKKQITVNEMLTHKTSYKNAVKTYEMLAKDRTQTLAVTIDWEE